MNTVDEQLRRQFESDWISGSYPDITDYLPEQDSAAYLSTLEELVCIELEFRWSRLEDCETDRAMSTDLELADSVDQPPLLEEYLNRFPELRQPAILQRLIEQEILVRNQSPLYRTVEEYQYPTVEEYQRRFPDVQIHNSSLHRAIADRTTMERGLTQGHRAAHQEPLPRSFGEYDLVELLGRGGMGSVYRARQVRAKRDVAIKVLHLREFPADVQPELKQRFQAEVRAAAALSHDHVMPIYDVGEVDGVPYYTMPLLNSDVAEEVRRQPASNEQAARYMAQAARGLAAAHEKDLLHRDVKPHNLVLDSANDRVLVADFGLAKLTSAQQHLTRTGEIVGTLPYMAPEQVRQDENTDARADIYSLGATLYHLLLGRPPFQAATAAETMRQVLEHDPVPPRTLNPQVNRDLETICLRCLQKDQRLRFSSALELAQDLERAVRGEPIKSRPLSVVGRLVRWRRRHPRVAGLSAGILVLLILLVVVAATGWYSTQQQLARVVAVSQEGQASLDDLFTFVRTEPLLNHPGQEGIRRELLQRGVKHYQQLLAQAKENKTLPADILSARVTLALLTMELEGPESAIDWFQLALKDAKELERDQLQSAQVQGALGDSWNGLGQSYHRLAKYPQAAEAFDKAIAIREALATSEQKSPASKAVDRVELQRKLANAIMNRGIVYAAEGQIEEARNKQDDAQQRRRKMVELDEENPGLLRDMAQGEFNLARLDLTNSNVDRGIVRLKEATERFKQLTQRYPNDAQLWQRYVECLLTLAVSDDSTGPGSGEQISPSLGRAIEILQPLAMLAAENRTYRITLIELYQEAIEQLLRAQAIAAADQAWGTVEDELIAKLDERKDTQPNAVRVKLVSLRQRGLISLGLGRPEQAGRELRFAVEQWRRLSPKHSSLNTEAWKREWNAINQLAESLVQ